MVEGVVEGEAGRWGLMRDTSLDGSINDYTKHQR